VAPAPLHSHRTAATFDPHARDTCRCGLLTSRRAELVPCKEVLVCHTSLRDVKRLYCHNPNKRENGCKGGGVSCLLAEESTGLQLSNHPEKIAAASATMAPSCYGFSMTRWVRCPHACRARSRQVCCVRSSACQTPTALWSCTGSHPTAPTLTNPTSSLPPSSSAHRCRRKLMWIVLAALVLNLANETLKSQQCEFLTIQLSHN
jgi:hypothetical protein